MDDSEGSPSSDELVAAAAGGDRKAVEVLLERYLPDVRAFVRLRAGPMIRAQESCSDLVQSVCREVLQQEGRFRHANERAFKRWLFTEALRKILKRQRFYGAEKRDVRREIRVSDGGSRSDGALLDCYRSFTTASQKAIAREEVERIERAFEHLPEDYREVITLAHLVGLSRKEIGEQMGKTEGAVRILLHRAIARLCEVLAERP